jgi:hypothetical protein
VDIVQRWKKRGAASPLVGRLSLILRQTAKSVTVPDDYRHFSVRNPDDPWTGSVWGRGTDEIFASISLEGADV